MPGLPSRDSAIEAPTGWAEPLMRGAGRGVPAAELIRPAGMKPCCIASRKRFSHCARRASGSARANARATRARTWDASVSPPFAYFSSRTPREMACSGRLSRVRVGFTACAMTNILVLGGTMNHEVATLAGGCFWCLEAVFDQLKGVQSVESGYMGGKTPKPTYEEVCGGRSGHAEVVQVTFDPALLDFEDLLGIFF